MGGGFDLKEFLDKTFLLLPEYVINRMNILSARNSKKNRMIWNIIIDPSPPPNTEHGYLIFLLPLIREKYTSKT